jgi:hypothetical protein
MLSAKLTADGYELTAFAFGQQELVFPDQVA